MIANRFKYLTNGKLNCEGRVETQPKLYQIKLETIILKLIKTEYLLSEINKEVLQTFEF